MGRGTCEGDDGFFPAFCQALLPVALKSRFLCMTSGPLLHAKFHPHRCNGKGIEPPKLKFLLRFDQNVEYKRPAGAYPLRDFHKTCRVCTPFQDALAIKIALDLLKGLWSYGGFKLTGSGMDTPYFQRPLAAKLCVRPQKFLRCKNVLEVLYHHAMFGGLAFHPPPWWPKTLSFFVCLSVRHAFERQSLCTRFRRECVGVYKRF